MNFNNNTLIPLEVLSGQFIYNFTSDSTLNVENNYIHYNSASHILSIHVVDDTAIET